MLKKIHSRIPAVYVCGVLAFLPLVFCDGFFDINRAKFAFFVLWTFLGAAVYLFTGKLRFSARHLPLLALCLFSAVSTLLSEDPADAFWGAGGRLCGWLFLLCAALGAWLASQGNNRLWSVYAFLGAGCIVSLLGTINFFRVDPLGFYEHMRPNQTEQFLSTIGNIDLFGAYLCLLLPVASGIFLHSEKNVIPAAVTVFCAALAVLPCRAEGGMLALTVTGFLCLRSGTKRGFFAGGLLCTALLTAAVLILCFPESCYSLAGASGWYIAKLWYLLIPAALACFAAAVTCGERAARMISRTVTVLAIALIAVTTAAFVWFTFFDRETPMRAIFKYLRFSDSWGSYRGGVWTRCLRLYGELPLTQKLFGVGPDSLETPLYAAYGAEITAFSGMRFDNAHCVPLQYLLTTGLTGLAAAAAAALIPLVRLMKSRDGVARSAGYGCLVYLICALFTVNTPAVSPLFWVLLYAFGGDAGARA